MLKEEYRHRGEATRRRMMCFIREYFTEHSYAPSIREIGAGVGLKSSATVHLHIEKLFDMGLLETDLEDRYGAPRAFRIAREKKNGKIG